MLKKCGTGSLIAAMVIMSSPAVGRTILPDGPLRRGEVVISGDWAFACNNRGLCSAIGVPDAKPALDPELAALPPITIRIALMRKPTPGTFSWLHLPGSIEEPESLSLGGKAGLALQGRSGRMAISIPNDKVEGLFQELAKPVPHIVHSARSGKAVARMPQHGFAWGFDALQRVYAFHDAASGPTTDPTIRPDNAVTFSLPKRIRVSALPPGTYAICSGRAAQLQARMFPLSDRTRLWQYICARSGRDDGPSLLFSQKDAKAPLVPVVLPDPTGSPINAGQVWQRDLKLTPNILLSSASYAGPEQDCGKYWIWVLTRDGFRLISKREMPKCGTGLSEAYWLDTYDASFLDDLASLRNDRDGS